MRILKKKVKRGRKRRSEKKVEKNQNSLKLSSVIREWRDGRKVFILQMKNMICKSDDTSLLSFLHSCYFVFLLQLLPSFAFKLFQLWKKKK
jgi:hypothetical protein